MRHHALSGRSLGGLLALNAVLLCLLAVVTFAPAVGAQTTRARGNYTMVAGRVNGTLSSAVYIVDTANQELMVVAYNHNAKQLEGIVYRDLAADAAGLRRTTTPSN